MTMGWLGDAAVPFSCTSTQFKLIHKTELGEETHSGVATLARGTVMLLTSLAPVSDHRDTGLGN